MDRNQAALDELIDLLVDLALKTIGSKPQEIGTTVCKQPESEHTRGSAQTSNAQHQSKINSEPA